MCRAELMWRGVNCEGKNCKIKAFLFSYSYCSYFVVVGISALVIKIECDESYMVAGTG